MKRKEGPLRILYHHRTQAEDAQGIHIYEIIRQFRELGHEVGEVALVSAANGPSASRPAAEARGWLSRLKSVAPPTAYELMAMGYNLVGGRRLTAAIRRFRPDFIYERYSLFTTCGVRAARRFGIPIILEVNAPLALEQEELGQLRFRARARRVERWTLSNADRVIVVSTPMKRIFEEAGVPGDRMKVVPNGVDPDFFHGRDTGGQIREHYGLGDAPVLGFVGWMRRWHGLAELVRAMAGWTGPLAKTHLLLVGDGPARAEIEAAAQSVGLSRRVHISGPVTRDAMPEHIAAFDVALQPAATPYASPMKVFEYLAMGKPVVACGSENLREILEEGTNATFFPPGDMEQLAAAARRLLIDPAGLQSMSAAARRSIVDGGRTWRANASYAVELARDAAAAIRAPGGEDT